jgi:hypothetical protein
MRGRSYSDSITQVRHVEVDQQAQLIAAEFQIGENLSKLQRNGRRV